MKRIVFLLVAVLGALGANAATLNETFDKTFDATPGGMLVVSNINGRITIHASNDQKIHVHAEKRVEARDADAARQAMAQLTIEATPADGGVRVITHAPESGSSGFLGFLFGENVQTNITYDVTVPRTFNTNISNTNGAISMSDISGALRVETTNGRIELSRCAGTLDAETTNGAIRAELLSITPGKDLNIETTNGRISLVVPATLAANIDAETTNGSITTDLPVTTKSFDSNSLRGMVGGGGPRVKLRTTNGGIEIRTTANQSAAR
jgi:DUF4097 and DUF4098 domain-containing protein YvlB